MRNQFPEKSLISNWEATLIAAGIVLFGVWACSGAEPATKPTAKTRVQGDNRFADPVQYGVPTVNGSLVIRTGEVVYCARQKTQTPQPVTETTTGSK